MYTQEKNWEKAKEHFETGVRMWTKYKNKYWLAFTIGEYANMFFKMRDYKKAVEKFKEALAIYTELKSVIHKKRIENKILEIEGLVKTNR